MATKLQPSQVKSPNSSSSPAAKGGAASAQKKNVGSRVVGFKRCLFVLLVFPLKVSVFEVKMLISTDCLIFSFFFIYRPSTTGSSTFVL